MRTLKHDGRNLVVPFAAVERRPGYRGAKLVPSPNRIADGAYTFKGHNEQLGINETDRMTALHGLVLWNEWKLPEQASAGVVLGTVIEPQEADPWISGRWSCQAAQVLGVTADRLLPTTLGASPGHCREGGRRRR